MLCTPKKLQCKILRLKIISSKQIRDVQCIMLTFKNKMLYYKPCTKKTKKTKKINEKNKHIEKISITKKTHKWFIVKKN